MSQQLENKANWFKPSVAQFILLFTTGKNRLSILQITHQSKFLKRRFLSRQNVENKFVLTNKFFFRNFNPIRRALRENLSNRTSGVQIPRDICAPFGRYLYSTKCTWIIKCISPTNISEWNEMLPLRGFCTWNTKKLLQTGRVASWLQGFHEQNFLVTYTSEWGGTQNEVWETERWLNQVTNPVYPKIWKTMIWSLYHCAKKFWYTANQRGGRSFTWVVFKVFVSHYIRPSTSTNNLWQ